MDPESNTVNNEEEDDIDYDEDSTANQIKCPKHTQPMKGKGFFDDYCHYHGVVYYFGSLY